MKFVREQENKLFRGLWYKRKDGLFVVVRDGEEIARVIVPESLRASVIRQYHNSQLACHQGRERTWRQLNETFYWPGMKSDVTRWVKCCMACRRRKTPRPIRAGITEAALATRPNETVAMDIWGPMFQSEKGNVYVLTMIDTFTRWPVATPIKDRSSATIAKAIFDHWICDKSVPMKIISDQAREFTSELMQQFAKLTGTRLLTTSGYNPTGNSSVERFHRYLGATLAITYEKVRANWDDYIPAILFSYRASINDTTGYSPFFLETGREPNLPLDNLFDLFERPRGISAHVEAIRDQLDFAFRRANAFQQESI